MSAPLHLSVDELFDGVRAQDRSVLARAITLVESTAPAHRRLAQDLLARLLPFTGTADRVGISGVPGVGKSTFIEALGLDLIGRGHRVAVLAVDPSSEVSGGSILGDKTRMAKLSVSDAAYIRPSPTRGALGGVNRRTRETLLLCEAAGFDVVLVETVGVGQSETLVADMVDAFVVLLLAGAGDELQGIKRGILEVADVLAVNKADGDNLPAARRAALEARAAMRLMRGVREDQAVAVELCSGLTGEGLDDVWGAVQRVLAFRRESGRLDSRRADQRTRWMWALVEEELLRWVRQDDRVGALAETLEEEVRQGTLPPTRAAWRILDGLPDLRSDLG